MLQFNVIDTKTLELLEGLQSLPLFSDMRLVGGTSLALQIGHRKSVDIDLFGKLKADEHAVRRSLSDFNSVKLLNKTENISIYLVNEIKVDIVNYPYPWIEKPIHEEKLTLAGEKDIAAMKFAAITGRGTKKDFIDIFFLLGKYSLKELMSFYNKKYSDGSEFLVLKSLSYFDDADSDESPVMLKQVNWNEIKIHILSELEKYIKK